MFDQVVTMADPDQIDVLADLDLHLLQMQKIHIYGIKDFEKLYVPLYSIEINKY